MAHIVEIYKGLRLAQKLQPIQANEIAKHIFDAYIQNTVEYYEKTELRCRNRTAMAHSGPTQGVDPWSQGTVLKMDPKCILAVDSNSSGDEESGAAFSDEPRKFSNQGQDSSKFLSQPELRGSVVVEIHRRSGGPLGLGIAGGADKPVPPIVSCLKAGSVTHRWELETVYVGADRSGLLLRQLGLMIMNEFLEPLLMDVGILYRCSILADALQVGDRLVAVNGIKITSLKHEEILTLLRNAGDLITIEAEYDLNDICFDRLLNVSCRTTDISLDKESGSFGFIMRGGAWGPDKSKSRPLTVTSIRPGGPADREGRLRVSDRILSINGVDVSTSTLAHALSILKQSEDSVTLSVEYDVSILETVRNATGPLLLEIDKPPGLDLGVSLCIKSNGQSYKQHICIDGVIPASIGDRCGALHSGDEILSIDDVELEYTTLAEAHQLLKGASSNQIKLEIVPHSQMHRLCPGGVQERPTSKGGGGGINPSIPSSGVQKRDFSSRNLDLVTGTEKGSKKPATQRRHSVDAIARKGSAKKSALNEGKSGNKKRSAIHQSRENSVEPSFKNFLGVAETSFSASSQPMNKNLHIVTSRGLHPYHSDGSIRQGSVPSRMGVRRTSIGSLAASVSGVPCGQVCHSEVMEVVLSCFGRGGYGLVLHRSPGFTDDTRSPLFISYIERGSHAEKSGVLQVGDRILSINDWCATSGTADEANYIVRQASGSLALTVEFDVIETVLPSSGIFTVKLAKRGQNLGVVILSSGCAVKGEPVIVSDIRTGSAAHRCGSIHPGDQILAIDNIPLDSCSIEEAVRLLQRASDIVKLRVRKNPAFYDEMDPGPQHVVYSVELNRKGGPLGITIAGTDDRFDPIVISQLAPGGLAERTGAIHIGDRILAINGSSLQGKRVSEAIQVLQQAGETVSLKIARTLDQNSANQNARFGQSHFLYERATTSYHDGYGGQDQANKVGTPVQSIDSAVESLEDSPPLTDPSQHPSSNRNSHNSKASSLSGHPQDNSKYVEDLSIQLHKSLQTLKSSRAESSSSANTEPLCLDHDEGHYASLGGDACPCQTNLAHVQDEWMRVLEALETVGEAEMLRKLEESILHGTVPCDNVPPCKPDQKISGQTSLAGCFPITNTILRHPLNGLRHQNSAASSGSGTGQAERDSNSNISIASSTGSLGIDGGKGPEPHGVHQNQHTFHQPQSGSPLYASINHNNRHPQPPPKPMHPHASVHFCSPHPSTAAPIRAQSVPCGGYDINGGLMSKSTPSPAPGEQLNLAAAGCSFVRSFENIPYITSPLPAQLHHPAPAMCSSPTPGRPSQSRPATPSAVISNGPITSGCVMQPLQRYGGGQTTSICSSSIQLSGSVTPLADEMNSSTHQQLPLEIYRVTLEKDRLYNDFGFSVSDGVTEKGVYINKIRAGGPADVCGNIRPLDRLLQVNDTSLRDLDCLLAVPVLAAAGDTVDLIICRDPNLLALNAAGRQLYSHREDVLEDDTGVTAGTSAGGILGPTTVKHTV